MKTELGLSKEEKGISRSWIPTKDDLFLGLKMLVGAIAAFVVLRVFGLYLSYVYFLDWTISTLGFDSAASTFIAIVLTAVSFIALPSIIAFALFGVRRNQVLTALVVGGVLVFSASLISEDVYFDRKSGDATKCFAKTLEGFRFSRNCDYDPNLGVRYQKVTPEIAREIYFWKRHGKLEKMPVVEEGKYFDPLAGDAIVWYSLRPDGVIALFPLPGFDPVTGAQLLPITQDVVKKYDLDVGMDTKRASVSARMIRREINRLVLAKQDLNKFRVTWKEKSPLARAMSKETDEDKQGYKLILALQEERRQLASLIHDYQSAEQVATQPFTGQRENMRVQVHRIILLDQFAIIALEVFNSKTYPRDERFAYRFLDSAEQEVHILDAFPESLDKSGIFINEDFLEAYLGERDRARFFVILKSPTSSIRTGYVNFNGEASIPFQSKRRP